MITTQGLVSLLLLRLEEGVERAVKDGQDEDCRIKLGSCSFGKHSSAAEN